MKLVVILSILKLYAEINISILYQFCKCLMHMRYIVPDDDWSKMMTLNFNVVQVKRQWVSQHRNGQFLEDAGKFFLHDAIRAIGSTADYI